jgi:hypothetical protein
MANSKQARIGNANFFTRSPFRLVRVLRWGAPGEGISGPSMASPLYIEGGNLSTGQDLDPGACRSRPGTRDYCLPTLQDPEGGFRPAGCRRSGPRFCRPHSFSSTYSRIRGLPLGFSASHSAIIVLRFVLQEVVTPPPQSPSFVGRYVPNNLTNCSSVRRLSNGSGHLHSLLRNDPSKMRTFCSFPKSEIRVP